MRIIVNGAGGRMGRVLCGMISDGRYGATLTGAAGRPSDPVRPALEELTVIADCIIDVSHHSAIDRLVAYGQMRRTPLVIATTGHTKEEIDVIQRGAEELPIFFSGNLSLGVALLIQLVRDAAAMLKDADVEIIERHHNGKLDVPSGTAWMISRAISEVRSELFPLIGRRDYGARDGRELGIHSLRMGNAIGTHEVIFSTDTECVTLKHEAQDRTLYADGALRAAAFLIRQPPGLYDMEDLLRERSL